MSEDKENKKSLGSSVASDIRDSEETAKEVPKRTSQPNERR
jgi:hypothetical protein